MSASHAELGQRAVKTAEIALRALEAITALLDEDCDDTRIALYNPRHTVAKIRRELEQAHCALTDAERAPVPAFIFEGPSISFQDGGPVVVDDRPERVREINAPAILERVNAAREPNQRPLTLGGGWDLQDVQSVVLELLPRADGDHASIVAMLLDLVRHDRRIERLERPVADRDAIAWEIGRSAGIRGDSESLNPFRVSR